VVAGVAWLLGTAALGTAILVLVVATIAGAVYTVVRGDKARFGVWGVLAVGWAVALVAHWAVSGHGGFFVGLAAWLGIIVGARRAGISKAAMPLLAFPLVYAVLLVITSHSLLKPFGISWLWVAAVLGPVIGIRTLLNPSPRDHQEPAAKPDPLAGL
jgi:hypothetical protein